MDLITLFR